MTAEKKYPQNNMRTYIVPNYGDELLIIKALKTVKELWTTILFGKED